MYERVLLYGVPLKRTGRAYISRESANFISSYVELIAILFVYRLKPFKQRLTDSYFSAPYQ